MKIQLLSDLHLEQDPDFAPQPAADAELLILAGDIGSCRPGSLLLERGDDEFGLARFSPRAGKWPVPVAYMPGNHEYDGSDFDATHDRLQAICRRLGIAWLERETLVADGVRIVGTTLWTDFDALAVDAPDPEATRQEAFRAADRYLRSAGSTRGGEPWLAEPIRAHALECQRWLRGQLAQPFDGATVVVTHFAPSLRSADPRYGVDAGTAGFCNALDALLEQADVWLHGHLHYAFDYRVGRCRVVANPLGYASKGERSGFQATLTVTVPDSPLPPRPEPLASPAVNSG